MFRKRREAELLGILMKRAQVIPTLLKLCKLYLKDKTVLWGFCCVFAPSNYWAYIATYMEDNVKTQC